MHLQKILDPVYGETISKQLVYKNNAFEGVQLFIPAGKELKQHISNKDALILVLEGEAEFKLENEIFIISKNDGMEFKAGQMHSIRALTDFSMLLLK